jgi:hypothetical protein
MGLGNQVSMIDLNLHGNPVYKEAKKRFKVVNLFISCELHRFAHPEKIVEFCQSASRAGYHEHRNARTPYNRHRRIMCAGIKVLLFSGIFTFLSLALDVSNAAFEGLVLWLSFEFFAKLLQKYEIHLNPPVQKLEGYFRITWKLLACGIITAACAYVYRFFIPPSFEIESLPFWIMVAVFIGFIILAGVVLTKFANELKKQMTLLKAND